MHYRQLTHHLDGFKEWGPCIPFVEEQGMAPLFYFHLRAAGIDIPEGPRRQLQALTLRHRLANQARTRTLINIITACGAAGVRVILLKGAALFHLIYPEPGLRPMRDLDLLINPASAPIVQNILSSLGFQFSTENQHHPTRHLPVATAIQDGFTVNLELHRSLFEDLETLNVSVTEGLIKRARLFSINNTATHSLSLEDMLFHLHRHMVIEQGRIISMADLISLSEQFVEEIDWQLIFKKYPALIGSLSVFHSLNPLSEALVRKLSIRSGRVPRNVGVDFCGWPRLYFRQWRNVGLLQFIKNTVFPSEWWLRLYYGVGPGRSIFLHRWIRYPLHVLRLIITRFVSR